MQMIKMKSKENIFFFQFNLDCMVCYIFQHEIAIVPQHHQYYCHCTFQSWAVKFIKEEEMKITRIEKNTIKKENVEITYDVNKFTVCIIFLFSFTCLPTQFEISSFMSFIYPLEYFSTSFFACSS